jgi:hypothetical protein
MKMATRRNQVKTLITYATIAVAVSLAAWVVRYALHLLIVGEARTIVPEISNTGFPAEVTRVNVEYVPYPAAVVPLVAAVLLVLGLLSQKLLVAWLGLAMLSAFAMLFLFSHGGPLLPVTGLLLIVLGIITIIRRETPMPKLWAR